MFKFWFQIKDAHTLPEINDAVDQAFAFLSLAGCLIPVRQLSDGIKIVERATGFYVVDRLRSQLERYVWWFFANLVHLTNSI